MNQNKFAIQRRLIDMGLAVVITLIIIHFTVNYEFGVDSTKEVKVCFSPGNHCDEILLNYIQKSVKSIHVQAYAFTSKKIANALIEKHGHGVKVAVLYDVSSSKSKHSQIPALKEAGIEVMPDRTNGLAHNKVMIFDRKIVVTGSYNWSNAAEYRNAENMLYIEDIEVVNKYQVNWLTRYNKARAQLG